MQRSRELLLLLLLGLLVSSKSKYVVHEKTYNALELRSYNNGPVRTPRYAQGSRGSLAFVSKHSQPLDDDLKDQEYPNGTCLARVSNWVKSGIRTDCLTTAIKSPVARLVYGLSGAAIIGAAGVNLARRELNRVYRSKFATSENCILTELFGNLLIKNVFSVPSIKKKIKSLYKRFVCPYSFLPTGTAHVPTMQALSGKTIAIYLTGGGLENYLQKSGYGGFTSRLIRTYKNFHKDGLEVVYVSLDDKPHVSATHFSTMPWYAVPFDDPSRIRNIIKALGIKSLPAVVIIDSNGKILNQKAYNQMLAEPDGFPWVRKTLQELLSTNYVDSSGGTIEYNELANKRLALFFGDEKTPGSRALVAALVKAHKEIGREDFEAILVSSDRDIAQFNQLFTQDLSILAIPFSDSTRRTLLQEHFDFRGLPMVVMLDAEDENGNRQVLNRNAASQILKENCQNAFPWLPTALNDLTISLEGITDGPALIVFLENSDENTKKRITQALEKVAKETIDQSSDVGTAELDLYNIGRLNRKVSFFFVSKTDPKAEAIRLLCQLQPADKDDSPRMVVLDLADQSFYRSDQKEVTEESIEKFFNDFSAGIVNRLPVDLKALKS